MWRWVCIGRFTRTRRHAGYIATASGESRVSALLISALPFTEGFAAAITIPVTKVERASKQQKIGNEPGHDTLPTLRPPPRAPGFRPLLQRGGKSTAACLNLGAPMPHEQMVPAIHSGRGTGSIDRLKPLDWHVVVGRDGVVSLRPSSGGCGGTGQTPQNIKT